MPFQKKAFWKGHRERTLCASQARIFIWAGAAPLNKYSNLTVNRRLAPRPKLPLKDSQNERHSYQTLSTHANVDGEGVRVLTRLIQSKLPCLPIP